MFHWDVYHRITTTRTRAYTHTTRRTTHHFDTNPFNPYTRTASEPYARTTGVDTWVVYTHSRKAHEYRVCLLIIAIIT